MKNAKRVLLCNPRGFCAGVERAIEIVELAIKKYGSKIYVKHEIVHNRKVIEDLQSQGVIFIEDLTIPPAGSIIIFSAHGVSAAIEEQAAERNLHIIDATCPLVKKVHNEAKKYDDEEYELIIIGHRHHPEIEGTSGRVKNITHIVENTNDVVNLSLKNPAKVAYVTQTTLSIDDTHEIITALQNKFPLIKGPSLKNICYATQNRQNAVKTVLKEAEILLVIGSHNSSNSNRLRDLGLFHGIPSYLIEDHTQLNPMWFDGKDVIGITAGASAPASLLDGVIEKLHTLYDITVDAEIGIIEDVKFKIPRELER